MVSSPPRSSPPTNHLFSHVASCVRWSSISQNRGKVVWSHFIFHAKNAHAALNFEHFKQDIMSMCRHHWNTILWAVEQSKGTFTYNVFQFVLFLSILIINLCYISEGNIFRFLFHIYLPAVKWQMYNLLFKIKQPKMSITSSYNTKNTASMLMHQ